MPLDNAPFDYEAALAACARGQQDALRSLYDQESRRLLGVALRIVRQHARAEDVVQEAFVNIWRRAASFDAEQGSGRGWIYSVVRNLALNAVRDAQHEQTVDEGTLEALSHDASLQAYRDVTDAFELNASLGRLNGCLEHLEPVRRNCILYAYLDGCAHGEIATRVGAPLGTVKAWIRRSLGALRECMA